MFDRRCHATLAHMLKLAGLLCLARVKLIAQAVPVISAATIACSRRRMDSELTLWRSWETMEDQIFAVCVFSVVRSAYSSYFKATANRRALVKSTSAPLEGGLSSARLSGLWHRVCVS